VDTYRTTQKPNRGRQAQASAQPCSSAPGDADARSSATTRVEDAEPRGRGGSGRSEPAGATNEHARRGNTSRYRLERSKGWCCVMLSRVDGRAVFWASGDVRVLLVDILL
jgi:hypothetical protein